MRKPADPAFGTIRSFVWPIYRHELSKLIPMFLMLFFVCFNYSILRNLKDAIVITAEQAGGAQAIPFIKVWAMLPAVILSTIIFTMLSNHFSRKTVFHIIVIFFLLFFFLFAFWIYPNRDMLHPHATANLLESILPKGFKGLISMFRNWTFTCFYVIAELWGSIVLGVVFWGFANEVTRISEASRFYSVMSIGSNIAASIAGYVTATLSWKEPHPNFIFNQDAYGQTFVLLLSIIILSGIGFLIAYNWMERNAQALAPIPPEEKVKGKRKEKKLSFRESLMVVAQSKYLLCIATLVVSYFLVIGLVEIIWKDKLSVLKPDLSDYLSYTSTLTSYMGIISTFTSVLMAGIIGRFGWTKTALITPVIMLITSTAFFSCLFAEDSLTPFVGAILNTSPLAIAVFLGSMQNCFSKAAKYSLFDATKEMAFIPLSSEHKLKGKAAIDGIGSRLGKAGSSFVHQGLLFIFWSLSASAPYVAAILLIAIGLWILAVISLGKQFKEVVDKEERDAIEPQVASNVIDSEPTVAFSSQPATAAQAT